MTQTVGLRERHKQRTRQSLLDAAMNLFEKQGYENTTVAQITAAAEVSQKTFFNYFRSKDDVVFTNPQARLTAALEVIGRRGDEPMTDILVSAVETMLGLASQDDLLTGLAGTRLRMITNVPALQATALQRLALANGQLARALSDAYPSLDDYDAAIAVGTMLGAVLAATVASVSRGDPAEGVKTAVRRGISTAVQGLVQLDRADPPKATTAASRRRGKRRTSEG